jgi:hypothetical protein
VRGLEQQQWMLRAQLSDRAWVLQGDER